MISRIFLDTDVLMDLMLERPEFTADAYQIMKLQDSNSVQVFTSALSLANIAYFSKKFDKDPFAIIRTLLKWIQVVSLEKKHFEEVVTSTFRDLEDGLQFFMSQEIDGVDTIITRNTKDFKHSTIPVLTPKQFLSKFQ